MRLVHLSRSKDFSPFDVILRNGCGPHFVLNRLELFESMIKDQGVTFWFRFWLDFCYYPGCEDLATINNEWPEMRDYVNTGVHTLFVKGSLEEACQYSLNVIKLMRFNLPDLKTLLSATTVYVSKSGSGKSKKKKKDETFFDVLQSTFIKCTGMAFGANLCVLFYEWLAAHDANETSEYYWCAPKKYFEQNFQPGELEIFLANEWRDKLVWLLGVSYYQVPWLRKLLTGKLESRSQAKLQHCSKVYCMKDIKKVAKLLSIKRNEKRVAIQRADEMSNIYENKISIPVKKDRKRKTRSRSRVTSQENWETVRSVGSSTKPRNRSKVTSQENWETVRSVGSSTKPRNRSKVTSQENLETVRSVGTSTKPRNRSKVTSQENLETVRSVGSSTKPRNRSKVTSQENWVTVRSGGSSSSHKRPKCAHCYKSIKRRHNAVVCKRCVDERWTQRRCYCDGFCKVQHWYRDHQKEHYDIRKNCSEESFTKSLPLSVTKTIT